jgi:hypothetical protein
MLSTLEIGAGARAVPDRENDRRASRRRRWRDTQIPLKAAERPLMALKGRDGVTVRCETSVADIRFGRGALSIGGMKRGMIATVDGQEVRIWRPRFGLRLRDRPLFVEGRDIAWTTTLETTRRYRITDRSGADLLRRQGREVLVETTLPSDQLSLLVLIHLAGVPFTSTLRWYFAQGLG